jgi:hypothetical protein
VADDADPAPWPEGGILMPGLNLGALIAPYGQSPLTELTQAFSQFPQMQEQAQLDKLAVQGQQDQNKINKQIMAQNDIAVKQQQFQLDQSQQQAAQTNWNQMGQQFLNNPQWAINPTPAMRARLQQLGDAIGVSPFDENGSVNINLWKQSWNALSPDDQMKFWSMQPDVRAEAAKNLKDLPPDFATRPRELDPKVQAQISAYDAEVTERLAAARKDLDQGAESKARINLIGKQTKKADADAQVAKVKAAWENRYMQSEVQKNIASASASFSNAAARAKEADAAMLRASHTSNAATGQSYAAAIYRKALDDTTKAKASMAAAAQSLSELGLKPPYTSEQISALPDPTQEAKAVALIASYNQAAATEKLVDRQLSKLSSALQSNFTIQSAVKALSDKENTVTNTGKQAEGGYEIGSTYVKDGKNYKYLGGPLNKASSWQQQ